MKPILSFLFLISFFLLLPNSKAEYAEESSEMVSVTWVASCSAGTNVGMCEADALTQEASLLATCGEVTLFQINYE